MLNYPNEWRILEGEKGAESLELDIYYRKVFNSILNLLFFICVKDGRFLYYFCFCFLLVTIFQLSDSFFVRTSS